MNHPIPERGVSELLARPGLELGLKLEEATPGNLLVGVGGVGVGMERASLARCGEGRVSRAGMGRVSLARCVGQSVSGVGVGMGRP